MTIKDYNKSVEEYSDLIFRFILHSLKDRSRAEDIVQDTWEKLWRNHTTLEYVKVKSWLYTTSYNTMIDIIRKESRTSFVDDTTIIREESRVPSPDLNEILHKALERLPEGQRSVILLRDYEGYSYEEIGKITGQTEAQVKINIYRGRMALRNYIGKMEAVI